MKRPLARIGLVLIVHITYSKPEMDLRYSYFIYFLKILFGE